MGRPPLVDRDAIVRAALEIGFDRLTMSSVGARLGAAHSTLYRYFASRDALASAAIDRAVDTVDWPEAEDDWRSYLVALAWSYWDLYQTHPGLAAEVSTLRTTSHALVAMTNRSAVALLRFGFDPEQAVLVVDMLGELVTQAFLGASTSSRTKKRAVGTEGAHTFSVVDGSRQRRVDLMTPWLSRYDERIRPAFTKTITRPPAEQFQKKLDILLAGVAALIG